MFPRPLTEWLANPGEPTGGPPTPIVTEPTKPHPDMAKPPAGPGEMRAAQVYMPHEEYAAIQKELADLRTFRQAEAERAEAETRARLKAELEKGRVEESLKALDESHKAKMQAEIDRAESLRTRWLEEKRTAVLNEALTGITFAGPNPQATAAMVRKLLAEEVEATLDSQGNPVVVDRTTRRPAVDYLRERLSAPEFAVFHAATTRGGVGTDGARPNATPTPGGQPENPNAAFAAWFRDQRESSRNARF
jgi:hypothetical protein